jgi:hypothetical protein
MDRHWQQWQKVFDSLKRLLVLLLCQLQKNLTRLQVGRSVRVIEATVKTKSLTKRKRIDMTHFDTMNTIVNKFFDNLPKSYVVYCDYIAHTIVGNLKANDTERLLSSVSRPKYDLTESGGFASTKKTIEVEDRNGRKYRVTVEEVK